MMTSHEIISYPIYNDYSEFLLRKIKTWSIDEVKKNFDLSEKLAVNTWNLFHNEPIFGSAIFSYTGIQYKEFMSTKYSLTDYEYMQNHLFIISGLYGYLRPFDIIQQYRLPMETGIDQEKLCSYWKKIDSPFHEDEIIVNLASQEYSCILPSRNIIITIDFFTMVDSKKVRNSVELKKIRGRFLRYVVVQKVTSLEQLRNFSDFGYQFDEYYSTERVFTYVKIK